MRDNPLPPIPLADDTCSIVERESEITGGTETPPTPNHRSLSVALCELAGLDPNHVTAIRYDHPAPEDVPTIIATMHVLDNDGDILIEDDVIQTTSEAYEWRRCDTPDDYREDRTMYNEDDTTTTTGPSHYGGCTLGCCQPINGRGSSDTPTLLRDQIEDILTDEYGSRRPPFKGAHSRGVQRIMAAIIEARVVDPGAQLRDGVIIRDPQPNDVLIIRTQTDTTPIADAFLTAELSHRTGCKVVSLPPDVDVVSFAQVGEDPPPTPPPPHHDLCQCPVCCPDCWT